MIKHPQASTQRQIKKLLRKHLFGRNIFCPECRSYRIVRYQERYRCRRCKIRFSLISHTWLSDSNLKLTLIWKALWCFVNQVPVKQALSITGLSEKAVRSWYDKARNQLPQLDTKIKGTIQVDEVYIGGWKGKAIIAGKETVAGEVRFHICESYETHSTDVYAFFERYIEKGSIILTDSSPLYPRICRMFSCPHKRDIHKKFEFHLTSEIEGLFGVLRTFIRRMYHHVSKDKLPEYLVEFQYRFSRKKYFSSVDQFVLNTLKLVTKG